LWPKPKMLFRCNCGRKICGTKVMIPGEGVCVPYPFARTSGRRAVSAVSLFYYEADKQTTWPGVEVGVSRKPIVTLWTSDRMGIGIWDWDWEVYPVLEKSGFALPPRESCALSPALQSSLYRDDSAPGKHTHSVHCVYIDVVSSTGFQFDLETRAVSGPQSLFSSLLPTLPWPGAQRFR